MKPTYAPFDPADYLDNDEVIAEPARAFGVISNLASGKKFVARRCSNPSDTSTACVEFVPVEDTGPPVVDGP